MYFVDTCVIISGFEYGHGATHKILHHMLKSDTEPVIALTDFTLAELEHRGRHKLRKAVEKAVKDKEIPVYETGVRPGQWAAEKEFERHVDANLAHLVPDPSDAVLVAAAELFKAEGIITRDRHDLYTTKLYNYLETRGIRLYKPGEFEERFLK